MQKFPRLTKVFWPFSYVFLSSRVKSTIMNNIDETLTLQPLLGILHQFIQEMMIRAKTSVNMCNYK